MEDTPRIAELRKKVDKDPGSRLFAQLAEELRKEGALDQAIAVAKKGLEKHANYPSARLTLARALLDTGRAAEAKTELDIVVKASPDNILASKFLGDALDDLGQSQAALDRFELTLKLAPGDRALIDRITEVKLKLRAAAFVAPDTPEPVALPAAEEAPPPVAPAPPPVEALDRDLASGTFRPGAFDAADLAGIREGISAGAVPFPEPLAPPAVEPVLSSADGPNSGDDIDATVGFGELDRFDPPVVQAQPIVESAPALDASIPPISSVEESTPAAEDFTPEDGEQNDLGGQTLPLNSVTLADLYLQQGLKAEASQVLSQVLQDEPQNREALSRLAAVQGIETPAAVAVTATRRDSSQRAEALLRAFLSATEREATVQRATPQGQGTFQ